MSEPYDDPFLWEHGDLAREVIKLRAEYADLALAAMRFLNLVDAEPHLPVPRPWNATPSELGEADANLTRLLDAALQVLPQGKGMQQETAIDIPTFKRGERGI